MSILIAMLGISALIVLHELGHFWVARACGMRVLRFSVGFGPTLLQRQVGGTIWQLAAIPVGGFVHIAGMSSGDDPEEATAIGNGAAGVAFRDRPLWQRAAVVAAGPAANWLVCAALLAWVAGLLGVPQLQSATAGVVVGEVSPGGAAARAGLQTGDRVAQIDGVAVSAWQELVDAVRAHPGIPLQLDVRRSDGAHQLTVTPEPLGEDGRGVVQILPQVLRQPVGLLGAIEAGIRGAIAASGDQVRLLSGLVSGQGGGHLTGLPGIVRIVSQQAHRGLARLLETLSLLSVGLCFLNLMPIPGLDGSRLLLLGFEAASGRPLGARLENALNTVGFVSLVGLMLFVSLRDLLSF